MIPFFLCESMAGKVYVLSPSATAAAAAVAARFVCVIERGDSAATQPRTNSTNTINAAAASGSQRGAHAALLAAALGHT